MMKKYLFLFLFSTFGLLGQSTGRMETDRPDQTECPYIVKKGYLQAEMGFNKNVEEGIRNYNLPSTLWKYGVSKRLELRYVTNLLLEENMTLQQEAIGFKIKIFEPSAFLPRTSLIVHYNIRDEKRDVSDKNSIPHSLGQTIITFQHGLFKELGMGYNFGCEYHDDGHVEGIYRISPGINIGKNWYAYTEVFGRFPTSEVTDHWYDGGLAYYFSDHAKMDISFGNSFSSSNNWYLALGFSFRIKVFKE
jgi:hypothetical protein